MKLLPEQVAKMRETLEQLKVQYQEKVEEKASNARNSHIGTDGFDDINTSVSAYEVQDIIRRMNELETIINSAIIIEIGDSETIQIGSKFTATINFWGEEETQDYILCEMHETIDDEDVMIITDKSPLGKAVLGKKENDSFSYAGPSKTFNGVINKIHTKDAKTMVKGK